MLFAAAVFSAESIPAPALAGGQLNALVSIVFSVMAVEAFLNEATETFASSGPFASRADNEKVIALKQAMAIATMQCVRTRASSPKQLSRLS